MSRRVLHFFGFSALLSLGVALMAGRFVTRKNVPLSTKTALRPAPAIAPNPVTPTPQPRTLPAPQRRSASVHDLLHLPEDKIDVGRVALTLAKEIYPDIDVAAYSAQIDLLADEVRRLAGGSQDPDWRVRCLNTVIYRDERYRGSRDAVFTRTPEYFYLNRLLDTKQGNCLTMPLLYVAVGQRLGWPVYLVTVPDHFFVRYADPAFHEQNIEATSGGAYVPDERYAEDFLVSETSRQQGTYLRTLTYRETLGVLAATHAVRFGQHGQMEKAITYLDVAVKLNPRDVGAWANLASAHQAMAKRSARSEAQKHLAVAAQCAKKLTALGFVHPLDVPLTPSMGGPLVANRRTEESPAIVYNDPVLPPSRPGTLLPDGTPSTPDMTRRVQEQPLASDRNTSWRPRQ